MTIFFSRLVILVTFFANCSPDLPAIEKRLKEDKSRPGKVGTLRALEVIHAANKISKHVCVPPVDFNFEGEFKSELSIHLRQRNDSTYRRLNEKRILSVSGKIVKITTDKRTIDELGSEHHLNRTWIFDGENTVITTTLGHGEISGPRRSRSDEREKIFAAALSNFRAFRAFSEPKCVTPENQSLEKILKEITIDENEISDTKATINWRALSEGRRIEVKYNHEVFAKKLDLVMPKTTAKLDVQTSGFESARAMLDELKKEKLIK